MRNTLKVFTFILFVTPALVHADILTKLAAIYLSTETDSGGTKSETTRTLYDLNVAYLTQKGWAFGGIYAAEKISSGGTSTSRTSMGPSVGWVSRQDSGPYAIAHYFFTSELEDYKGDGYQADLGYRFKLGKAGVGLQMSYKSFTYKELNGTKLASPLKETKIDPYFVVMFEF